jgi:ice-binding like protein
VGLGAADAFVVLAGAGITNTGPSVMNGDIGSFATTSITNFPPGIVNGTNHGGDGVTQGAKIDLQIAYTNAQGAGPTFPVTANLGGQNLVPGVYNSASTLGLTGALTLTGGPTDVWIFQAGSSLTTASGSSVVFNGGAQACNVFWQIGSDATIGTGSAFAGTVLAQNSIFVTTGATIQGRALALVGQVTLDTNTITKPTCATAPIPPTRPPFTIAPSATPIVAPTTTPIGTAAPTAAPSAPTVAPSAPTATPAAVAGVQVLPSTRTDEPVSPLLWLGLTLAGICWFLLLGRQKGQSSR